VRAPAFHPGKRDHRLAARVSAAVPRGQSVPR
jgi:hypothetical protein